MDPPQTDQIRRNLEGIFAGHSLKDIVSVYAKLIEEDDTLIPSFHEGPYPENFNIAHFLQAKAEFECEYMKKYILPKFTDKENVIECILDAQEVYGLDQDWIDEAISDFKEDLNDL